MIWRDFITKTFSIKSAYYEARKVLGRENAKMVQRDKVWRRIWTTKVAPKLKYFMRYRRLSQQGLNYKRKES